MSTPTTQLERRRKGRLTPGQLRLRVFGVAFAITFVIFLLAGVVYG